MKSQIKSLKAKNDDSKKNESIAVYTKKCIKSELEKLEKMKVKVEISIKNHDEELKDKKTTLSCIEDELKKLKDLDKQCLV